MDSESSSSCGKALYISCCRVLCCFSGSYESVRRDGDRMDKKRQKLPKLIDIFGKMRGGASNNWVAMMRRFHVLVSSSQGTSECLRKHASQWKLHLYDFLLVDIPSKDPSMAARELGHVRSIKSLATEFLHESVTTLAELDFYKLQEAKDLKCSFLQLSQNIIMKGAIASRLSNEFASTQTHHYVATILAKLSSYLCINIESSEYPVGINPVANIENKPEERRSSSLQGLEGMQGKSSHKQAILLHVQPGMESDVGTDAMKGDDGKLDFQNEKTEQRLTAKQWHKVQVLVKVATQAICEPPRAAYIANLVKDSKSPVFILRVVPPGQLACQQLVKRALQVLTSQAVAAVIYDPSVITEKIQPRAKNTRKKRTASAPQRTFVNELKSFCEVYRWFDSLLSRIRKANQVLHRGKRRSRRLLAKEAKDPETDLFNTLDGLASALARVSSFSSQEALYALQVSMVAVDNSSASPTAAEARSRFFSTTPRSSAARGTRFSIDDADSDSKSHHMKKSGNLAVETNVSSNRLPKRKSDDTEKSEENNATRSHFNRGDDHSHMESSGHLAEIGFRTQGLAPSPGRQRRTGRGDRTATPPKHMETTRKRRSSENVGLTVVDVDGSMISSNGDDGMLPDDIEVHNGREEHRDSLKHKSDLDSALDIIQGMDLRSDSPMTKSRKSEEKRSNQTMQKEEGKASAGDGESTYSHQHGELGQESHLEGSGSYFASSNAETPHPNDADDFDNVHVKFRSDSLGHHHSVFSHLENMIIDGSEALDNRSEGKDAQAQGNEDEVIVTEGRSAKGANETHAKNNKSTKRQFRTRRQALQAAAAAKQHQQNPATSSLVQESSGIVVTRNSLGDEEKMSREYVV